VRRERSAVCVINLPSCCRDLHLDGHQKRLLASETVSEATGALAERQTTCWVPVCVCENVCVCACVRVCVCVCVCVCEWVRLDEWVRVGVADVCTMQMRIRL
jgi:hypothetical protein